MNNLNELASNMGKGGSLPWDASELSAPYSKATPDVWENYYNYLAGNGAKTLPRPSFTFDETLLNTQGNQVVPPVVPPVEEPQESPPVVPQELPPAAPYYTPEDMPTKAKKKGVKPINYVEALAKLDRILTDVYSEDATSPALEGARENTYPSYEPTPLALENISNLKLGSLTAQPNTPNFPVIGDIETQGTQGGEVPVTPDTMQGYTPSYNPQKQINPFNPGNQASLNMQGYNPYMSGYKPEMAEYGVNIPLNTLRQEKR
jgi:hypothetical protein